MVPPNYCTTRDKACNIELYIKAKAEVQGGRIYLPRYCTCRICFACNMCYRFLELYSETQSSHEKQFYSIKK